MYFVVANMPVQVGVQPDRQDWDEASHDPEMKCHMTSVGASL